MQGVLWGLHNPDVGVKKSDTGGIRSRIVNRRTVPRSLPLRFLLQTAEKSKHLIAILTLELRRVRDLLVKLCVRRDQTHKRLKGWHGRATLEKILNIVVRVLQQFLTGDRNSRHRVRDVLTS